MLASITPLGERGRQSSWIVTVTAFLVGATVAAAALGTLAGAAGSLVLGHAIATRTRLVLLAAALLAAIAFDTLPVRVPGPYRQVNERWLDQYRRWIYASGFGAQLGVGVVTIVVTSAVYGVWAAALASAHPAAGAVIGAAAGAMRGATLLAGARTTTPQQLVRLHEFLSSIQRPVRRCTLTAQLALVGAAAVVLVV